MHRGVVIEFLTVPVKGNEIHLYPVCDVQVGCTGVDLRGFQEYIDEAMADPLAHFVGVGDYTDGVSPSNRRMLRSAFVKGELYDTAEKMLEGASERDVMTFLDIVKPTRGRWDFLFEGHHFWQRPDLRTSDQDIADYLGCPNLGRGAALVSYQFKTGSPLVMYALHGGGAGDSFAAPLNRLERQMRAWTAHIYLTGHHHKLTAARAVKLDRAPESTTQLSATDSVLVAAGSWMHGFVEGTVSYAEEGQMVPLATGAPVIYATKRKNGTYKVRVMI